MTSTNYHKVMDQTHTLNPYVIMREDARLTQLGLAEILDISEQVIRKLEYGLYAGANRLVSRELLDCLPKDYLAVGPTGGTTGDKINAVAQWYEEWQNTRRKAVGELLSANEFYIPETPLTPEDFYKWVMAHLVSDEEVNLFEFCKALSLHPYTVQRWVNRETRDTTPPPSLVGPLRTTLGWAGVDLDHVVFARARGKSKE